jgi:hypothetical protein
MSQSYTLPVGTDARSTAIKTTIPNCLEALRSVFSGATAPTNPVAYQLWADTSTGLLKQRNAANSAWETFGALNQNNALQRTSQQFSSLSVSTDAFMLIASSTCIISRVAIVSDTATSSSSGNEWQFELHNLTAANELFSATVGTFTALGGVGGGAELAVDTTYVLTPDANTQISANQVVEFRWVEVGSATTLTRATVFLEFYARA